MIGVGIPAMLQQLVADPQRPPVSQLLVPLIYTIVKILVVFTVYMVGVAMLTFAERKISAWIQDRLGPNRVLKGWGQPLADGVKNFAKEETLPAAANKPLFLLAPALSFIPALSLWAIIPFARAAAPPVGPHGHGRRRPADRLPVHPGAGIARRLRRGAGRLGIQ